MEFELSVMLKVISVYRSISIEKGNLELSGNNEHRSLYISALHERVNIHGAKNCKNPLFRERENEKK